jgi:thimet oligopeptidase
MQFDQITAKKIDEFSKAIIAETKKSRNKIIEIGTERRNFENTILAWDNMYDRFNSVLSVIYLLAYVHPEEAVISECQKNISLLNKLWNEIQLDVKIYKAYKDFEKTGEAKALKPEFSRFLKRMIRDMERNGLALPEEERRKVIETRNKIADISLQFSSNIAAWQDELIVNEEEIKGLPDDYREMRKNDDGTYKIDLSYPSYHPFMKYSESDEARKKLYIKFKNRAADANLPLLKQLLTERKKLASQLGFSTYADLEIDDKMAKKSETVWDFEYRLAEKVKMKAEKDLQELLESKSDYLSSLKETTITAWESAFFSNRILRNKYHVDPEQVKEYFELHQLLNGLFQISEKLFKIRIEKSLNIPVWHPEVIPFQIIQNGKVSGYFYLDLHPREKKYSHAACFSMINGKLYPGNEQLPVASLVCNFPKPTKTRPSLLPHSDVETMFHEFGHLLHHLLSETELAAQSGISTAHDFVEVPSQMFENWAWDYEALSLFARHHKTGEALPRDLYNKMIASRNLGSGIHTLQQIFYGVLDMTLHNKFDPGGTVSTTKIVKELQNQFTPFPFLEGTYMEANFDHLTGYAAGYYGYLWAKVYAEDVFSEFRKEGIFNAETGLRLKKCLLSRGGTMEEKDMLLSFLGREPNEKAFLESLGI